MELLPLVVGGLALAVSAVGKPAMPQESASPVLPGLIREYQADLGSLTRLYDVSTSPNRRKRLADFYAGWQQRVGKLNVEGLTFDDRIDLLLLRNHLTREAHSLTQEDKKAAELAPLLPFAASITALEESRRRFEPCDPEPTAEKLDQLSKAVQELKAKVEAGELKATKTLANRAAQVAASLRQTLGAWFEFYNGYDPLFTWWCEKPYHLADESLKSYRDTLREKLVGVKPDDRQAIVGLPVGREALEAELAFEMIPYTPEELIAIGEKEFSWCEKEMKKASADLGFGDDWKKALEHVKNLHVEPGKQPHLVHELAVEAIDFLKKHDLVTIPPLAEETWRMEMMSAEAQKTNPFFLGGESIIVSFPTREMSHEEKRMSMRGNNRYFSRATVQHELIPGHHLQQFMNERYRTYREPFYTPFWTEGWALYWEMLLWDQGFAKTPEDRVGMLFWRMHRCARIVFSLKFHLGEMSPEDCIKFLVDRVGHEPANAEGEVRRSFSGDYPPLYQLAYMIGGLQFRALHKELVDSGRMTNRDFHDAILKENNIPVEVLRMILTKTAPGKNAKSTWKFAG